MLNPRRQVGYINITLLSHCVLDDKCIEVVRDSLCTLVDPTYIGKTPSCNLVFQTFQEWEVLDRVLKSEKLTPAELLGLLVAGKAKPFFLKLAQQANHDANYRTCDVPPGVRLSLRTNKCPG
jgi:hypothetical protein